MSTPAVSAAFARWQRSWAEADELRVNLVDLDEELFPVAYTAAARAFYAAAERAEDARWSVWDEIGASAGPATAALFEVLSESSRDKRRQPSDPADVEAAMKAVLLGPAAT